jgi:hypothetical protein
MSQTMLLVDSYMGPYKTFVLVAVDDACPYVECVYEPTGMTMFLLSKNKKQSYKMLPKLNDNGDPERLKMQIRDDGKDYKEERRLVETFHEIIISGKDSIEEFVEAMAVNAGSFDYKRYMIDTSVGENQSSIIQM